MKAHTFRPRGPRPQEAIDGDFQYIKYSRGTDPSPNLAWDSRVVWRRGVRSLPGVVCEAFALRRGVDPRGILPFTIAEEIFARKPLLLAGPLFQRLDSNYLVFQPLPGIELDIFSPQGGFAKN